MDVTLLYFDGCPNLQVAEERLTALQDELGFELTVERVDTPEDAMAQHLRGSPTVLVDGRDPFAAEESQVAWSCRLYQTPAGPAGTPTLEQLREVLG